MKKIQSFIIVALTILLFTPYCFSQQRDDKLSRTISSITKSFPVPATDVNVTYDKIKKEVFVVFDTPISKTPNGGFNKLWAPWKLTQLLALREFEKARIPVKSITVETNFHDGSGRCRIINNSNDIKRYANSDSEEEAWHKSGYAWKKDRGFMSWEKLD